MAESVKFTGANQVRLPRMFCEEDGLDVGPRPIYVFETGCTTMTFSAWRLSEEELAEIGRTRLVWRAQRTVGAKIPATYVGSRSYIIRECAEFGGIWNRHQAYAFPPIPARKMDVNFDFRDILSDEK